MVERAGANFIKLFWCNLNHYWHIASHFDSGYAARGINCNEKSFMILTPSGNFIKLFWFNLHHHRHIGLRFDLGYPARGINCDEKSFMKLIPSGIFIKLFWCNFGPQSAYCLKF
jgi:hypothetical protein